eukprot:EC686041.1.p1 GENE.EC686041.1~~EC686041.1.p1  ORF type:complete len:194 (+),score=77.55 EC686041.1:1-582(+)
MSSKRELLRRTTRESQMELLRPFWRRRMQSFSAAYRAWRVDHARWAEYKRKIEFKNRITQLHAYGGNSDKLEDAGPPPAEPRLRISLSPEEALELIVERVYRDTRELLSSLERENRLKSSALLASFEASLARRRRENAGFDANADGVASTSSPSHGVAVGSHSVVTIADPPSTTVVSPRAHDADAASSSSVRF